MKNPTAPAVQVSCLRDCVKNPLQCKRRLGAVCSAVQEPDSECQAPLNLSGAVVSCSGVERACEPLGAQAAGLDVCQGRSRVMGKLPVTLLVAFGHGCK